MCGRARGGPRPPPTPSGNPNPNPHPRAPQLHSPDPNPHTLVGALVGGPHFNDTFPDDRMDYAKSEVGGGRGEGWRRRGCGGPGARARARDPNSVPHPPTPPPSHPSPQVGIEYNAGFTAALAGAAQAGTPWGACMQGGGLANRRVAPKKAARGGG